MERFKWTPSNLTTLRKKCKTHTAQQVADEVGCSKSQAYTALRISSITYTNKVGLTFTT